MPEGPIFIVGPMGTGTTLLRLMLDSHDNIAIPQETGFMRAYNAHQYIPFKWSGRGWAKRMGWSQDELDALLGQFYDTVFRRYAEQHGARRWGDKTPLHTWHIDAMARLYPEAQFIGIIRHPGGSVGSNVSRFDQPVKDAVVHYRRYAHEITRQAARYPDRFATLRYEDLVFNPEQTMRELLDYLGEEWSDKVLEHHNVQSARGGKAIVEGRSAVADPIDVARVSKWTTTLKPPARKLLRRRLRRIGEFYGYVMQEPATLEPVSERGDLVVRGDEIAARIERFPELDLRTQGTVPRYEQLYDPRYWTLQAFRRTRMKAPPPQEQQEAPDVKTAAVEAARILARPIVPKLPEPARKAVLRAATRARARTKKTPA